MDRVSGKGLWAESPRLAPKRLIVRMIGSAATVVNLSPMVTLFCSPEAPIHAFKVIPKRQIT